MEKESLGEIQVGENRNFKNPQFEHVFTALIRRVKQWPGGRKWN